MEDKFVLTVAYKGRVWSTPLTSLGALKDFIGNSYFEWAYKPISQIEISKVDSRVYLHIYITSGDEEA